MSSTGTVSKAFAPTNSISERQRTSDMQSGASPGLKETVRWADGKITEVDEKRNLIRAVSDNGSPIANGQFIRMDISDEAISMMFGQLRVGMRVNVKFRGPDGAGAIATVTHVEGEKEGTSVKVPNTMAQSVFAIFAPGSNL